MPAKRVDIVRCKLVKECPSIHYGPRVIGSPDDAYSLVKSLLMDADREMMVLVCLDRKGQPTHMQTVSIGTLSSSLAHPREIFKAAILSNAGSIILAHNHPSGDPAPSLQDIEMTNRIKEAGELLGIELTDHIIVGHDDRFVSLKTLGRL